MNRKASRKPGTVHPPAVSYPKPPAQVDVYVEVLGPRKTVEFLLTFGGAALDLSRTPTDRSRVVQLVGSDKARELAEQKHRMQARVPLAKKWLAACLLAEGRSVNDIARTLRCTDVSARNWLSPDGRS
ncbi:MAG: helix-turn-helix domain-containing protein [Roseovarius sp.]|nr:helix-turn-helix domain-containing protein [Roseovarius sp.]